MGTGQGLLSNRRSRNTPRLDLTTPGLLGLPLAWLVVFFVVPIAAVFYMFEVVIVIGIQAFIFAALSAIYIGSAIEPEH